MFVSGCEEEGALVYTTREGTERALFALSVSIEMAQHESNADAPTSMAAFVAWVEEYGSPEANEILEKNGMLRTDDQILIDGWGRRIKLIADGDRLIGFGSVGRNGRWEDGAGDDLFVRVAGRGEESVSDTD